MRAALFAACALAGVSAVAFPLGVALRALLGLVSP